MDQLPRALTIWNGMDYAARANIMQEVGYEKSVSKMFRKCIARIEASLAA